ncbi:MAG: hypothetical protein K2P78_12600 [Gemmataceae bacterium]|nr:hypothetical protein [Gemmataceae bacterium]
MSILIRDEPTLAAMAAATEPQDVRDADGRLLGRFVPAPTPKMSIPEVGLTDEELDRLENDPNATWVTPEQVMERLREIDRCSN